MLGGGGGGECWGVGVGVSAGGWGWGVVGRGAEDVGWRIWDSWRAGAQSRGGCIPYMYSLDIFYVEQALACCSVLRLRFRIQGLWSMVLGVGSKV